MKIVLIGTGNVGTVLGRLINRSPHALIQLLGRSDHSTQALAEELDCPYVLNPDQLYNQADLYLLAIQDKEIPLILPKLHIPASAIVVHTAGGVSIHALAPFSNHYGVLYPLQSLRKERTENIKIPLFLDASDSTTKAALAKLAADLSEAVGWANDTKRMKLHVAAVFCSNFTNYLFALSSQFCRDEQIDFQYLLPLIQETAERLTIGDPVKMQTGPAARKDMATMAEHLELLARYPEAKKIYQFLSDAIAASKTLSSGSS